MSRIRIVPIVEGFGEVDAVPVLIRRQAESDGIPGGVEILRPIRMSAAALVRSQGLERVTELAARKLGGHGGIFVLLDSEDWCPAKVGPALRARLAAARPDVPCGLVLAHREFEAWFIGASVSLAGRRELPAVMDEHPRPESIRGCKEWLSRQLPPGRTYSEVTDQPAFMAVLDLDRAEAHCPSFGKCRRELRALFGAIARRTVGA